MSTTKSKNKKQILLEREANFTNNWPLHSTSISYNPLEDKHTRNYFQLSAVQKHLRRFRKRAKKDLTTSQNQKLIQQIQKRKTLSQLKLVSQIRRSYFLQQKQRRRDKSKRIDLSLDCNQSYGNYNKRYQFSEILQRYSTNRRLPSMYPQGICNSESKAQNRRYGINSMMDSIICRRRKSVVGV